MGNVLNFEDYYYLYKTVYHKELYSILDFKNTLIRAAISIEFLHLYGRIDEA